MTSYPLVIKNENKIEVALSTYSEDCSFIEAEFVIDYNLFKDVVGIEILNLKEESGDQYLEILKSTLPSSGEDLRYSYDEETDSFYLQISNERSNDQKAVDGMIVVNNKKQILGFIATISVGG